MSRGETPLSKRIEDLIETYSRTGTQSTTPEHRETRHDSNHERTQILNHNEDREKRRTTKSKSPDCRRRCVVSHKGSAPAAAHARGKEHIGWRKCLQSNKILQKEEELPKDDPLENYQWTMRRRCIVSSKSRRKDEESPERSAENRIRKYHFNPRGRSVSPLKLHANNLYPTKSQENAVVGYCRRRKECHNTQTSETRRRCSPHHSKDRIALGLNHKQMPQCLSTRDESFVEKPLHWSCPKYDERKKITRELSRGKQKRCSPHHSKEHIPVYCPKDKRCSRRQSSENIAAYCPKEPVDECRCLKSTMTRHQRTRRHSSRDYIHSGGSPKDDNYRLKSCINSENCRQSHKCHEDIQKPYLWEVGPPDGKCWCPVVERPDIEQRSRNLADSTPTWKKRYPRKPAPPQTPVERQWNSMLYKRN